MTKHNPDVGFVLQIKAEAYAQSADRQRRIAFLLREIADELEAGPLPTGIARLYCDAMAVGKFE